MSFTLEEQLRNYVQAITTRKVGVSIEEGRAVAVTTDEHEKVPIDVAETVTLLASEIATALNGRKISTEWREAIATWPEWLRDDYEERSAIREYEARFPREMAELLGFHDIVERRKVKPTPPAPETFRGTSGGEVWVWTVDEMMVALDEVFAYIAKVREGEQADDTDSIDRLRFLVTFEAGPGAIQSLAWMLGEACEPEC